MPGGRPDRAGPLALGLRRRGEQPAILTLDDAAGAEESGGTPVLRLRYPKQVANGKTWCGESAHRHGVHNFRDFAYCEYRYGDFEIRRKPYQLLEAEVPAAFSELEDLFSRHDIRCVVHPNMGGEIVRRAVSRVARARGIPVLYESGTRYFPGKTLLVLDEMGTLLEKPRLRFADQPPAKQKTMREWLDERLSARPRVGYGNVDRRFLPLLGRFVRERKFTDLRRLARGVRTAAQFGGHALTRTLWRPADEGMPFVYYPIHFTVESNIILRNPSLVEQEPLLAYLARILPGGTRLCVKQHPGYSAEGMSYLALRRLARSHGVHILPATENGWEIIGRCRAVVTIHGTAGFEGVLLGRPVIVAGYPPYRGWGVTEDVDSLDELPAALDRAFGTTLDRGRILDFLVSFESIHAAGDWYAPALDADEMAEAVIAMFGRISCRA